jgi:hypothetical protein
MAVVLDPASSSRESWTALRNASSAAQLAVSMLMGPLAPWRDPAPTPAQLREILAALDATTRQINALVVAMAPLAVANEPIAANGPVMSAGPTAAPPITDAPIGDAAIAVTPVAVTPVAVTPVAVAPVAVAAIAEARVVASRDRAAVVAADAPRLAPTPQREDPASRDRGRRRGSTSPARADVPPATATEDARIVVGALLRQVAVDASLDPDIRLDVVAPAGLACIGDVDVMRAVLGRLVRDAAAMGPVGAIVEVRATSELTDALGDEMDVVIEVRPDARATPGRTFALDPADLVSASGETLRWEVVGRGGRPRARLRAAMAAAARILAA